MRKVTVRNALIVFVTGCLLAGCMDNHLNPRVEMAAKGGDVATVKLLLTMGGSLHVALFEGASSGQMEIVRLALERGTDSGDRRMALFAATRHGHVDIVKVLLDAGVEARIVDEVLVAASEEGQTQIASLLLKKGAHVNARVSSETALTAGTKTGHGEVVRLLLDQGADPNLPNAAGDTPLSVAREAGRNKIAQVLIQYGARNDNWFTAPAEERGVDVARTAQLQNLSVTGQYWALIIGIDKYQHVTPLDTAVRDAIAVRDTLIKRYGFSRERIVELLNEQATRANIEDALFQLGQQAGPEDSVFIYYAGHGQIDLKSQRGYWVPVEAQAQSTGTFVSNARIRDDLSAMQARHVYLVADSCFSGTLFAKTRTLPPLNDKFFARLYETKSRWGLTSGMNEPVADQGKDGHSVFAYFFLKLLNENDEPYLIPSQIYDRLAPLVSRNADQQPRSQPLQGAGDEGGQFVFRLITPVTPTAY